MDISDLTLRQLQTESARALSTMQATNNNIHQFNKIVFYRFSIELHKALSNMLVGCDYEITMNPLI